MYKRGDAIVAPKARKNMPAAEQLLRNRADRLGVSNKVRIMGIQSVSTESPRYYPSSRKRYESKLLPKERDLRSSIGLPMA